MIDYVYKSDGKLEDEKKYTNWLKNVILSEGGILGEICFVFTTDDDLLGMNRKYLDHDYYTDIITFNYNKGKELNGDIFISTQRVNDNAKNFEVNFEEELKRVMVHGVLHLAGYDDDTELAKARMRQLENEKLEMFHVEHI